MRVLLVEDEPDLDAASGTLNQKAYMAIALAYQGSIQVESQSTSRNPR